MRRLLLMIVATAAVSCSHFSRAPHVLPAPLPGPGLELDLFVPRVGPVEARLRLPRERFPSGTRGLALSFGRLDALRHAHGLAARVDLPEDGDLQLTWRIDVKRLGDTGPAEGIRRLEVPFDTDGARYLPMRALLPVPDPMLRSFFPVSVHVRGELPIAATLDGRDDTFWAESPEHLFGSWLIAGPRYEAAGTQGLRLISAEVPVPELQKLAALEQQASALLEASVGPRRPLRAIIVVKLPRGVSAEGLAGVNTGEVAIVLAQTGYDGAALSPDALVTLHELVHSSLPPDGKLPAWIFEGLTEYFALRLALTIDGFADETLRELVDGAWRSFDAQTPDHRVQEGGASIYSSGVVLAHCIEVRLRRDGTSLAQVLKRARAAEDGVVTNDQWEREIAVASSSAGARIVSARFDPLDPPDVCFREEGALRRRPARGLSFDFISLITGITGVNVAPGNFGVVVLSAAPGSPFAAGDRLTWVDGTRVVSAEHLQELLLEATAKGTTRIEFLRATVGRYVDLRLGLPSERQVRLIERSVWRVPQR